MTTSYWQRYWRKRLTRRGLLRGTALGAAGLAAAAVVGCGEEEEAPTATTPAATAPPAATATPAATPTPAIKRGGTYKIFATTSTPTTFDPHKKGASLTRSRVNSRLFHLKGGPGYGYWVSEAEPDVVESFEQPEPTVFIAKLRSDVKFGPPINRNMNADDVVFSFSRYAGDIEGVPASPEAGEVKRIFKSWTKLDDLTVRFDLNQPQANLTYRMASTYTPYIMPLNADKLYNVDTEAVGSGAWKLGRFEPDILATLERNPDWHLGPERPYLDAVDHFARTDYTSRLTQFLGGNADKMTGILAGDLKRVKDTVEGVQLDLSLRGDPVNMSGLTFSPEFFSPNAPFRDPRVRQAISMAMDRDAMTEATYDISVLQKEGLDVKVEWNSFIPVAMRKHWLDPKREGPNKMDPASAKYFQYDPEGAKNLLKEAGYEGGVNLGPFWFMNLWSGNETLAELTAQYLSQIGINVTLSVADYRGYYVPKIRNTGEYEGIAFVPYGTYSEAGEVLTGMYLPGGNRNNGRIDDPDLTAKINDIESDLDEDSRTRKILDLQNELVFTMYYVPMQAGAAPVTDAFQSYVRNGVEYNQRENIDDYIWLDV